MNREEGVYVYNGADEVPMDVTDVRVHPSVTIIPERAFENRVSLEEVELPEGLIRIGDRAFYDCQSLDWINIPSTVEEIGLEAFGECGELEHIKLPAGLRRLGDYAFYHCRSLKSINIPPGIDTIKDGTFFGCDGLVDVSFSEGLEEIGKDAFTICESLVSVNLPSSLKVIGETAFEYCFKLNDIRIHDNVEAMQSGAFNGCKLVSFRMPPLVNKVDMYDIGEKNCMVSIELSENVTRIEDSIDNDDDEEEVRERKSTRNIALPPECVVVDIDMWSRYKDLKIAFTDADNNEDNDNARTISDALKQRFNGLPIHKICYYQSYHNNETTMQSLRREINPWTSNPPGKLNTTGKEQDCLGMTPLHILACSTKPTIEMYRLLIDKYPDTLTIKDKWGDIPLMYAAFWCNAPNEVVDLLVQSYKSNHPDYEFDWKGMILILAKRNVPLTNIQTLVDTQQTSFPDQEYDMQQVVLELAAFDTRQANLYKPITSVDTVKYLLRVSISKRLELLGITKWRIDLENIIDTILENGFGRDRDTQAVYDRIATYESIKEGTPVLELALWKAKIDESRNKRARVEGEVSYRGQCRINCGADIIIRNVLPYLLPKSK